MCTQPAGPVSWPERPPEGWPPDWPWPPPAPGSPQVAMSPGFYAALFAACVAALMAMGVPQGEAIAQCLKRFIPGGAGAAGGPQWPDQPPAGWPPGWPWPPALPTTPNIALSPDFYQALFGACVAALIAMGVPPGEAIARCLRTFIPGTGAAGVGDKPPCWPPGLPWPIPGTPGHPGIPAPQPQGAGAGTGAGGQAGKIRVLNDIIEELEQANRLKTAANDLRRECAPPPHGALGLTPDEIRTKLADASRLEARAHDIEQQVVGKKRALSLLD